MQTTPSQWKKKLHVHLSRRSPSMLYAGLQQTFRIGEKLKIGMDLNSDEESDDFEDEDEEFVQVVIGPDENEENESEDAESLE
ncbi:hypothetical protein LIER_08792 [Lithospermum erythrorhizon]|uniref:Uncharacterized protein n=1 Tax=Lithospermum erythrorhizon TaxID=34254 RepID=A0AAV3PEH3_LITER